MDIITSIDSYTWIDNVTYTESGSYTYNDKSLKLTIVKSFEYKNNTNHNYKIVDLSTYTEIDHVSISNDYIAILKNNIINILHIDSLHVYKTIPCPNNISNTIFINNEYYISDTDHIYIYNFKIDIFETIYTSQNPISKLYNKNDELYIYNGSVLKVSSQVNEIQQSTLNKYNTHDVIQDDILNLNIPTKTHIIMYGILYIYGDDGLYRIDLENNKSKRMYANILTTSELSNPLQLYVTKNDTHLDIYLRSNTTLYVFNNDTYCIINMPNSVITKTYNNNTTLNTVYMNNCLLLTNILPGDDVSISTDNNWHYDNANIGKDKKITSTKEIKLSGDDRNYYNLIYNFICKEKPNNGDTSKVFIFGDIIP